MRVLALLGALLCLTAPSASWARDLDLVFRPASSEFRQSAAEYEAIWQKEGPRIVAALEAATGIELPEVSIEVLVLEATSNSGRGSVPMRLRASYPEALKRGTLVHELAHRYLSELRLPRSELSEHQRLNLVLLPVWKQLWGEDFASRQVAAESSWTPSYNRDWQWAISMSESERAQLWSELLKSRRNPTMH